MLNSVLMIEKFNPLILHFLTCMMQLLNNEMESIESILKGKYNFLIFNIKWDYL